VYRYNVYIPELYTHTYIQRHYRKEKLLEKNHHRRNGEKNLGDNRANRQVGFKIDNCWNPIIEKLKSPLPLNNLVHGNGRFFK